MSLIQANNLILRSVVKRTFFVFILIWSLLGSQALEAAQRPAGKPKPAPPAATTPVSRLPEAQFVNRVLPNGLEVIVLEDHSVPLVTIELVVKSGSYTEPSELNGLSHLYEHMFFKANRATLDREDYLQTIDQLGIVYNGQAQEERVTYYFTTTTPNFPVAMRFMRDAARYPLFDERQFEQERQVVLGELDRQALNRRHERVREPAPVRAGGGLHALPAHPRGGRGSLPDARGRPRARSRFGGDVPGRLPDPRGRRGAHRAVGGRPSAGSLPRRDDRRGNRSLRLAPEHELAHYEPDAGKCEQRFRRGDGVAQAVGTAANRVVQGEPFDCDARFDFADFRIELVQRHFHVLVLIRCC